MTLARSSGQGGSATSQRPENLNEGAFPPSFTRVEAASKSPIVHPANEPLRRQRA